jgi:hypothetical protein
MDRTHSVDPSLVLPRFLLTWYVQQDRVWTCGLVGTALARTG